VRVHPEPKTPLYPEYQTFLFLKVLPPVAGTAGFAGGAAFFAPIPLMVPITVFGTVSFFAGAVFLTTVVELDSLESLIVLALPLPIFGAAMGAAVLFPRPAPVAVLASVTFFVAAAPLVDFAFSTIFVRIPAAPPTGAGAVGFNGDTGRARYDFPGDITGLIGDRGKVREFADLGERTCEGWTFRDVVRAGGTGPLARFFGFSISSFSLSALVEISSLNHISKYAEDSILINIPLPLCGTSLW
jgi:hypothetical protein